MIILRVENPDRPTDGGVRPYSGDHNWDWLPTPIDDWGLQRHINDDENCGALPRQFDKWWPPTQAIVECIRRAGAVAVVLDVPDYLVDVGDTQVLFERGHPSVRVVKELAFDGTRWVL